MSPKRRALTDVPLRSNACCEHRVKRCRCEDLTKFASAEAEASIYASPIPSNRTASTVSLCSTALDGMEPLDHCKNFNTSALRTTSTRMKIRPSKMELMDSITHLATFHSDLDTLTTSTPDRGTPFASYPSSISSSSPGLSATNSSRNLESSSRRERSGRLPLKRSGPPDSPTSCLTPTTTSQLHKWREDALFEVVDIARLVRGKTTE